MTSKSAYSSHSKQRAHRVSDSSEAGLLEESSMAQLHPPYVVEGKAVCVKPRCTDQKRFIFQIDLKWSDDSRTTSHRSYSEFFNFQCDLLIEFPEEGGSRKGVGRTIPYLPGKKMFQKSNLKLAETRLPQIDEYVKALITMPENVSRSELMCRFFRSNWQEDKLRSTDTEPVRYSIRQMQPAIGIANNYAIQDQTEITSLEEQNQLTGI